MNRVAGRGFDVNIIPHTYEVTTLGRLGPGDEVNIEIDLVARYLERLMIERLTNSRREMAALNSIDEILEDLRRGKMAVIMDDEDRENEGDLIMAAECVRPEDVNFMARYGRGLICLTLTRDRCRQRACRSW